MAKSEAHDEVPEMARGAIDGFVKGPHGDFDQESDRPMNELKEFIHANRPDEAWADELRELREGMDPVTDPWRD